MASYEPVGRNILILLEFFTPHCADRSTMLELRDMAADLKKWRHAHALFQRIREKMLRADATKNIDLQHQYDFEEICAKTLFNLSDHYDPDCLQFPAPFDDDSAFWVFPTALGFARHIGKLNSLIDNIMSDS